MAPSSVMESLVIEEGEIIGMPSSERLPKQTESLGEEIDPRAIGGTHEDMPRGYYLTPSFLGTFTAVCLGIVCSYLGWVLPANTLSLINEDIGPDSSYVWIAIVWTLACALGYTLVGRLSDIVGRRWFFIGGNVFGIVGSIIGATAQHINVLIAANALVGLAAAVQLSFPVIIGELIPNRHRAYANAVMLFSALPFSVFGSVIARSFILHTAQGWRWSYYLNIVTSGLAVLLFFLWYHPPTFSMLHAKSRSKVSLINALDFGGIILFGAGLVLFLLGVSWGGQQYPWKDARVIGTMTGGVSILILFACYEMLMPIKYPLIPMRLFRNIGYVTTVITAAVGSMIYYSMNVLWPTQVSSLYAKDLLEIGWLSCTIGGGTLLGQVIGGALCQVIGRQKWQLIVGCVGMTAFVGALASSTASTHALAVAFTTIGSVFVGYVEVIVLTTAPLCLEPEDIGLAYGVSGTFKAALGAVATSIYVTILENELSVNIPKYVTSAAVSAGLPHSSIPDLITAVMTSNFALVPGINPLIIAQATTGFQTAYARSFRVVYLVSIAFGAVAIIAAMLTPNLEHRFNNEVARRLHGNDIRKREEQEQGTKSVELEPTSP